MGLNVLYIFIAAIAIEDGIAVVKGNESGNTTTINSTQEHASVPPAHSNHRLIPSVLDLTSPTSNSSQQTSNINATDDVPFLPSGLVSSYRSVQTFQEQQRANQYISIDKKNFTPSYFIGEVIPEPYVPERFQNSRSSHSRNSSNRSYQNPVSSQTALTFQKILPIVEQIKQAALPPIEEEAPEPVDYRPYHHHVAPVHEPSMEEEDSTTPKYSINYEDDHQHSARPRYLPYKFEGGHYNTLSAKPIAFEGSEGLHHHKPHKYDHVKDMASHQSYEDSYSGHGSHQGSFKDHHLDPSSLKDFSSVAGHQVHSEPHYDDFMNAHSNHHFHDADLVLPSTFYPPEPEIPLGHLKDVHYKVYQQKPWGLLPLAAALVPLGLLVAALNPNVLHINSTEMMPPKHRSLEGMENLEGLKLEVDCQKRAFCEAAAQGAKPETTSAHRTLWKLANSIPDDQAKSLNIEEVLKAVKSDSCSSLKCHTPQLNSNTTSS